MIQSRTAMVDDGTAAFVGYGLGVARGARVLTEAGYRPIETLSAGDEVVDMFGDHHQILAIRLRSVNLLDGAPDEMFPIEFQPGSMGQDCPNTSVRVSRGQSVVMRGVGFQSRPRHEFALARAEYLLNTSDVRSIDVTRVTYIQLLFEKHVFYMVNGLAIESGVVLEAHCPAHQMTSSLGMQFAIPGHNSTCGCGKFPRLTAWDVSMISRATAPFRSISPLHNAPPAGKARRNAGSTPRMQ